MNMKWTYRKWNTWEVFYISDHDIDENALYCEASYYENSYWFDYYYVYFNSKPASLFDRLKYKLEYLLM